MKECPTCNFCFDDGTNLCPNDRQPLQSSLSCETILGGRYQLERRLGKGGMGTVFKAKHKFIKTLHAIKIISPEVVKMDETLLLRFHQEAVLAASIRHPNVVTVTDYGIENNMPYLVMEYIDGISLTDYLGIEKRLSPERAYEVLSQIAQGLGDAHKKGIVHRDLKPLNVMLRHGSPQNKGVKVLDFGLAKIKTAESYASLIQAKTTNVLGSPLYMSPEQWSNENIDNRADIYSIGVMLFQMLAGDPPFTGETLVSLMYKHLQNEPPSFASFGVAVPPEIEAVVRRTLAKEREQRPATVEQLLLEYEQALSATNPNFGQITEGRLDFISSDPIFEFEKQSAENRKEIGSDSDPSYIQSLLSPSENQAINTFLNLPKTIDLKGKENLAQEFIEAQNRLEDARYQENQAERLAQEFAAAQKSAEEARQKAVAEQERLEEEARLRIQAELEGKLAEEREAREKAEAEAKLLLAEAKARKEAEERAKASAQAALEAQQRAEMERRKAEKEAQQRQIEEQTRRRAEEAAIRLAEEAAEAKRQYEEAKKEAEAEAYRRIEAEQRHKEVAEEIRRNEEYFAEQRRIAEAKAAQEIKEQVVRLEKQAFEAERKAEETRLLVENEARKRREAEAARIKAEEEARRLAAEIIEAQKRLEEMQQLAESEARKREQETEARREAENSARSLLEKARQEEANLKAGNGAANKDDFHILPDHSFGERQKHTQAQMSLETTANVFETNQIPQRNFLKKSVLYAALPILIAAAVGFYVVYKPINGALINNNVGESNINQNINSGIGNNRDNAINSAASISERVKNKMVKINGGTFQMGRDDVSPSEGQFYGAQFPSHPVNVEDFYLDQTEVTNGEYAEFVADTGHSAPENWKNGKPSEEQKKLPVTNVTYFDARDFANWISKRDYTVCRLPSEEEWEYAARSGTRQNVFPWGSEWIAGRANVATGALKEVGASGDVTELWEIKDMMGNVIEWTSSPFGYYPNFPENLKDSRYKNSGKFTLRGLSFSLEGSALKKTDLNFTYRQPASGGVKQNYIGFRLACNSK